MEEQHRCVPITQELPKLPVPPLEQTMERYLQSTRPLLSDEEFRTTSKIVDQFMAPGGTGEKLQSLLEERADKTENWLAAWWLNWAYLGNRVPLPVNCTLGSVHQPHRCSSLEDQLNIAAAAVVGFLNSKHDIYANQMPVEKMGPYPLDMSQFYYLFASCRVPDSPTDQLRLINLENLPRHIAVAHKNHFFKVPVYGSTGQVLNQAQIVEQLRTVVQLSPEPSTTPVGIFTTEDRDTWGGINKKLKEHSTNLASLDAIESALFLVSLDGPRSAIERSSASYLEAGVHKLLHGGGSKGNSANRWFDTILQVFIGPEGGMCVCYEHSAVDGYCMAVIVDRMETYVSNVWDKGTPDATPAAPGVISPERLEFVFTEELHRAVTAAEVKIDKLMQEIEIHPGIFKSYGKEFIKQQGVSPDSFIQVALQLAFYRTHGCCTAQYESASTRMFHLGRTETIRSCTLEVATFVRAMDSGSLTPDKKVEALRAAIKSHRDYVTKAVSGQGVDRHLLGLKLIAEENNMAVPDLFQDVGFARSSRMLLSTSQVAMKNDIALFYGPMYPDGYGICYNPRPHDISFGVTALRACPDTSAARYAQNLQSTLLDLQTLLTSTPPKDKL